jgi:O-succinylhomoserine sulfhydrylase
MSSDLEAKTFRAQTNLVRGGQLRSEFQETSEALYLTSGYVYASAEEAEASFKNEIKRYIYSRYSNPTVAMLEERMRLLEGAEACTATASGMAAVFNALACQLRAGDRLVASRALFGSCNYIVAELLPRFGVVTEFVDGTDFAQWEAALSKPARCVFIETPSNPLLDVIDIPRLAELAHAAGAKLVVDNVFASPVLQKPLALGADAVVYSATKHIDGQGRCLGGLILGSEEMIRTDLQPFMRHTGPAISPFNAWVLLKGLETLELRVRAQMANAQALASFLEGEPAVSRVFYPGLDSHPQAALAKKQMHGPGTLITYEVKGGKPAAFRLLNALKLIDISNNLGDTKTLTTHPATTTHQRLSAEDRASLGVTDGIVRLSIGIEDLEDIRDDLARGLAAARG